MSSMTRRAPELNNVVRFPSRQSSEADAITRLRAISEAHIVRAYDRGYAEGLRSATVDAIVDGRLSTAAARILAAALVETSDLLEGVTR